MELPEQSIENIPHERNLVTPSGMAEMVELPALSMLTVPPNSPLRTARDNDLQSNGHVPLRLLLRPTPVQIPLSSPSLSQKQVEFACDPDVVTIPLLNDCFICKQKINNARDEMNCNCSAACDAFYHQECYSKWNDQIRSDSGIKIPDTEILCPKCTNFSNYQVSTAPFADSDLQEERCKFLKLVAFFGGVAILISLPIVLVSWLK